MSTRAPSEPENDAQVTIDGRPCTLRAGETILHALVTVGIDIPSLCDDARLEPYGECRMCLVRVSGADKPVAACATPVVAGMQIETAPADIEAARRGILGMLARHYPPDAVEEAPDAPFHALLRRYGVTATGRTDTDLRDDTHPCIAIDMNRCIDCFRCVRICDEVQGQLAWQLAGRGPGTRVVPSGADTLAQTACVSCGACVDTCPTGALADRSLAETGTPTEWTRTTCPYCGVGCELLIGTRKDRIVAAVPAHDAPVNRGHACLKGRYAHGFVHANDRITSPMVRDADGWRQVSWDTAIATTADALRRAIATFGASSVGVLASARATNEDNYVLQKFARVVLRTNNVDGCARVCHAPSAAALSAVFGTGAATNSFDDIEAASTIFVCGANATENHPVVGARIRQAARRGASLIVIDPRRIELVDVATLHLRPHPGTNVMLLNALAATIVEEGLVDDAFVRDRVDGYDEYVRFLTRYVPEDVGPECGVEPSDIRAAARIYATMGPAMLFHGLGVTEHGQGTDGVTCLANLALLTGNLGRPGSGVNPLRGQNNVQGSAHMGCTPNRLPGYATFEHAARYEEIWATTIPATAGLDAMEMLDAAGTGELRALLVVGWDILQTQPNTNVTASALSQLDFVAVADLFLNETARSYADVFLPACSSFEKDGTFMNSERRVQRVRRVLQPLGSSRPDWAIVCDLAREMSHGDQFTYEHPDEIWDEVRRVWPDGAGMTYKRLEQPGGLQWPCRSAMDPGTIILHTDGFGALGAKTSFRAIEQRPAAEWALPEYPFVLITGRALDQFNAGTMTRRSVTQQLRPSDWLEMSPADAKALGAREAESVRVVSRYGSASLPVHVTDRVRSGELFATFHDPAVGTNRVTGPHRDATTHTPEYKVTHVRVEIDVNAGRQ
jgi:formate dehydrogenase major subunit